MEAGAHKATLGRGKNLGSAVDLQLGIGAAHAVALASRKVMTCAVQ